MHDLNQEVFWMDCEGRAHVYHFLSACLLKPPAEELLAVALDRDTLGQIGTILGAGAVAPMEALDRHAVSSDPIRLSFDTLFRVPGGSYAGPFESVYRDLYRDDRGKVRRRFMGPCAIHAAEMYKAAGCSVSRDGMLGGMPDFIGTELGFMAYLCEQEKAAADARDSGQLNELATIQRQFLGEHLTCWLPHLMQRVQEVDDLGFYAALLHLANDFVAWDATQLAAGQGDIESSRCTNLSE